MKLVLDTHIWIWSLIDPSQLRAGVTSSLVDPANELWLSSVSVWELLTLVRKKRIIVTGDVRVWLDEAFARAPLREAPVTHAVAIESERLSLAHWDPADRFIAATARLLNATLVTADQRLIEANVVKVLANR